MGREVKLGQKKTITNNFTTILNIFIANIGNIEAFMRLKIYFKRLTLFS